MARLLRVATTTAAALVVNRTTARRRARHRARADAHPRDHGLVAQDVRLHAPGGPGLHGWWIAQPREAPAVVLVHGYASHAGDLLPIAAPLHAAGFHVLLLDLRGHGRSEPTAGRTPPPAFAHDVAAAVTWLGERPEVGAVALLGHSMGGSSVILAASDRDDIAAVVTVAAVADPTLTNLGWWPGALNRRLIPLMARRMGRDPRETFAATRIGHVSAPLLIVHGERDRIVPVVHATTLADAAPRAELLLVPGAGHTSVEKFATAIPEVIMWLRRDVVATDS